jgi:hypothetical protein
MDCDSVNIIVSSAAKVITAVGGLLAAFWAIYIADKANGFEQLGRLLGERASKK